MPSRSWGPFRRALLISALSLCAADALAETVLRAPREVNWQDYLGINVQFDAFTPDIYQKQMTRLDQLGLNWVRWTLNWSNLEPAPGQYNLARLDAAMTAAGPHHYNVVAYLTGSASFISSAPAGASNSDQYPPEDFNLFAERMTALSQYYPHVDSWQVWNEPNITWLPLADPKAYYSLLTLTANAIRDAVPNKNIVTAGMAYYGQMLGSTGNMLRSMLDMGLGSQNIVAAYHPYSDYPEGDSVQDRDFLLRANEMNSALHTAGVKNVWATEWGWSSYGGPLPTQQAAGLESQANYTLRRLALMSALDYQRIFVFNLSDIDRPVSPRERSYGLLDLKGEPKPVYRALQNFLRITGPTLRPDTLPPVTSVPDDLYAVPWTRPDGSHVLMAWSESRAHLNIPGVKAATLYDPLSGRHNDLADAMGVDVPLKPTLQILVWNP
jgi:beta-xylosidase